MKKKGFTLIEIIVAIALIAVIGTSSVVGFNLINKNIKISKLEQITNNILRATEVYIETNKETKTQIYTNKNGAIIPLNVLIDEGLITLENTDLTKDDIKDEYVITMLSEENGDCINLKTITSWNESSNEPIYICGYSNSSSGGSGTTTNELSKVIVEKAKNASGFDNQTVYSENNIYSYHYNLSSANLYEPRFLLKSMDDRGDSYYFLGSVVDNYVNFANMCWRIVRINGDKSIKLILEDKTNTCDKMSEYGNWSVGTGNYGYVIAKNGSNEKKVMQYQKPSNEAEKSMVKAFYDFQTNQLNGYLTYLKSGDWCIDNKNRYDAHGNLLPSNSAGDYYHELAYLFYKGNYPYSELFKCSGDTINEFKKITVDENTIITKTDMYVGTLTAKELIFSSPFSNNLGDKENMNSFPASFVVGYYNYLVNSQSKAWWTLTPSYMKSNETRVVIAKSPVVVANNNEYGISPCQVSKSTYYDTTDNLHFRPAINLKEGIKIIPGGNGTINNPYVINPVQ